jgi:hypothetical protein
MAQFRYAALPAIIFRLVALSFSGMSRTARSAARSALMLRLARDGVRPMQDG